MFLSRIRAVYFFTIIFVLLILILNLKFFNFEPTKIGLYLANTSFSFESVQLQQKNATIFCFVKTHPGNFKSRLPKSYNNCIRHCTDYRFAFAYCYWYLWNCRVGKLYSITLRRISLFIVINCFKQIRHFVWQFNA